MTRFKVFSLGAINGLIVGLVLEKARIAYFNYQMTEAAREYVQKYAQTNHWADFIEARWEPFVPLASIAVFAIVSYLIYEFFMNRPRLLLMIWFGVGLVALLLGYFMSTSNPDKTSFLWLFGLVALPYTVHRLSKSHSDSLPLFWAVTGLSAVIIVALGVQLVGLFFYWPDLRRPLIWLICLVGVIAISVLFGVVVQLILNRFNWSKSKEASAQ